MKTTLLVLLAAAAGCSGAARAGANSGPSAWNGTIDKGDTVYVRNINGAIRIVPSSGNAVTVRTDARGGAKVEVVPHAGGVTICGVPKVKSYTCGPNGDLEVDGNARGNSKIDLEVEVPRGAVLDVSTINGAVAVERAGHSARVASVNGGLAVETDGPVTAETVNGSIDVTIAKLSRDGDIELATVNGAIHLTLPNEIDADVEATLVHGKLTANRALSNEDRHRHGLSGRLGSGGRRIELATVNGSIEID